MTRQYMRNRSLRQRQRRRKLWRRCCDLPPTSPSAGARTQNPAGTAGSGKGWPEWGRCNGLWQA